MKLRLLSMAGLVALSSACAVVGCSDDGVDNGGGGASGSSAGRGGSAGKSGSGNSAGKGGNNNTAGKGSAGEGSTIGGSGGAGATAGSGASAGSGATAGSSGGTAGAGGTSGSAGTAGKGGSGGTAGGSGSGGTAGAAAGSGGTSGAAGSGGIAGAAAGIGGTAGAAAGAGGTAGATAGAGGTAGAAAGAGGTAGATAGAGGAAAGSGGSGGTGPISGVEKFTAPFTGTSQTANFVLDLAGTFDLSAATIVAELSIPTVGSAAYVQYVISFVSSASGATFGQTCNSFVGAGSLSNFTSGFANLSLNVATLLPDTTGYCQGGNTPLEKNHVKAIGFQIAGVSNGTSFSTTTAYANSLTISGSAPAIAAYDFSAAAAFTAPTLGGGLSTATVTWQTTYP